VLDLPDAGHLWVQGSCQKKLPFGASFEWLYGEYGSVNYQCENKISEGRDAAEHLVFVGDSQRGIPPCAACHGPSGHKMGAPPLSGQHADYIERQMAAFAQDLRQNDINAQMRTIAKQLTNDEMQAIAALYAAQRTAQVAKK